MSKERREEIYRHWQESPGLRIETSDIFYLLDDCDHWEARCQQLEAAHQLLLDEVHYNFGCDSQCEETRHVAPVLRGEGKEVT